ncbi:hypothetical protein MSG28_014132 [Choristoneura fumiferana]|uniref:Uncharacterized protein n=1 Tax=Choristoneura fumiferana TaxID=7141 RepID=A0ACC0JG83_CHOFU|nr:hypothetical protein MSG28_014132 [Choristoneura fumiferana]
MTTPMESWQDLKTPDTGAVINILDIGQQNFANGGVVSRYLCDLAQCCHLHKYDYRDIVPDVVQDPSFQQAIEESAAAAAREQGAGDGSVPPGLRKKVEARAMKVLKDISSAMSNKVLK